MLPSDWLAERTPVEETERSLQTLIRLGSNPECVPALVDGLTPYLTTIMVAGPEHAENNALFDKHLMVLLNTLIQVRPPCVCDNKEPLVVRIKMTVIIAG